MARLLTAASSEYLDGSLAIADLPASAVCWFRAAETTNEHPLVSLHDGSTSRLTLLAVGNVAGDPVRCCGNGINGPASTTTSYSADTWHHAAGVWAATNDRRAYLDGGGKGTSTSTVAFSSDPTNVRLGNRVSTQYLDGRIAETAVWTVALTDAEIAALAARIASPLDWRRSSLVFYAPILGAGLRDLTAGITLTATGTTVADGPPVGTYVRRRGRIFVPVTVGGGDQGLTLPFLDSGAVLYAPTVTPGAVALTLPALASGETLYAPTVTPGAVALTLPFLDSGAVLYAPTVTPGAVALTLPALASGETLYAPTITATNAVTVPFLDTTTTLYAPTVSGGDVVVTVPFLASGEALYGPTVTPGAVGLTLPALASGETLYAPTVTPGAVALTLPALASGETLYPPSVAYTQALTLPLLTAGSVLYAPTVVLATSDLRAGLRAFLRADSTINTLTGGRIRPLIRPDEDLMPILGYTVVSDTEWRDLDGAAGIAESRVQLDCWATTIAETVALAEALRNRLDGYRGSMGNYVTVTHCARSGARDRHEPAPAGGDRDLYRIAVDYAIHYTLTRTGD